MAVSPRTEAVLRRGLAVKAQDRYQHIGDMLNDLYGTGLLSSTDAAPQANPFVAPGANSVSMTGQSMHLAPAQAPADTENKKKKTGIIIAISVAAAALIIGLVLILSGGRKDKRKDNITTEAKETTEAATPADATTEAATEETTEAVAPGGVEYVWPTELSDSWKDYTVKIDGTVYSFPMPYSEFKTKGWQQNNAAATIAAGDKLYALCYSDRAQIMAIIVNPSVNEAPVDQCYVIGISFDYYSDECKDDFTIELPGGVELLKATEADIKTAFGAPEYRTDGEYYDGSGTYVSLDYVGDEYEDGVDLEVSAKDNLVKITLVNSALPDALAGGAADLSTDAPEINSRYVAPEGASTDRFDGIITLDGKNYVLPVPFTELEKDGWTLDSSVDDYIGGETYVSTSMEKNGEKIDIRLENYTKNGIQPQFGCVSRIKADADYFSGSIVFPGGVGLGDDASNFEAVYSDLGEDNYSQDDYSSFIAYSVYNFDEDDISISVYADPETKKIIEYSYSTDKTLE